MSNGRARSKLVELIDRPAEFVNARTKRHGTVDTTSRDHNVGSRGKRRRNRKTTNVRISARYFVYGRECFIREHLGNTGGLKLTEVRHEIVTRDHHDFQIQSGGGNGLSQCFTTRLRIHSAGVADQLYTRFRNAL